MGNPLKKIEPWIDPIGNQGQKAIAKYTGLGADPKTGATAPGYNPAMKPGAALTPPPAGYIPPPDRNANAPARAYIPNYFQVQDGNAAAAAGHPATSTPLPMTPNRGPMVGGTPFRGGTVSPGGGGTPQMPGSGGFPQAQLQMGPQGPQQSGPNTFGQPMNPGLQRQLMTSQMLRTQ